MNWIDILLLAAVAAGVAAALRKCVSDRKNGKSCCGDCSSCKGCK